MNAIYQALAILVAWTGFGLLIAPYVGGMLKDRAARQLRRDEL